MSMRLFPIAAASSAVMHAAVVMALLPKLMPQQAHISQLAIEVTLQPPAQPTQGPAPAAAVAATEQAARDLPAGVDDSEETASELGAQEAADAPPPAPTEPDVAQMLPSPEPPPEVDSEEFGRSTAAIGLRPRLEDSLPPVQAPPRLTGRDFAMKVPPAMPKAPALDERTRATPPRQPIRQAKPRRASLQQPVKESDGKAWHAADRQPAREFSDRRAQQDYLWQIVRRLSQGHFYQPSGLESQRGIVVARITVARDGQLIDASIAHSSGFANLDRSVIATIRRAAPFPRFPPMPQSIAPRSSCRSATCRTGECTGVYRHQGPNPSSEG